MKKIILSLSLIFSVNIFGQISFTEFPKIGYCDLFTTMQSPLYYNNQPKNWSGYLDSSYYYPRLRELGINHVATFGGSYSFPGYSISAIPLNPIYNPTLKVLDFYFTVRLTRYDASNPMFLGGVYAGAQGNSRLNERYEVGGNITNYENTGNYGFGTTNSTSVWVINPPATGGTYSELTGETVFSAITSINSAGYILEANLPDYHQARTPVISADITSDSIKYKLVLNARIDDYTNSSDTNAVAYVNITEVEPPITLTTSLDFTYTIRVKDFGGNSYIDLPSPYFYKNNGNKKKLKITVYWMDKKNMYIDHFYIYDNFYERMFIASDSTATFNNLKKQLQNTFGSVVTNPLYSHFYYDEPWPNSYRALTKMSVLSNQQFLQNKYVNGAVGDYPNYMLQYGNSQGRLPYIMTDKYPFWYNVDTISAGSNSVQNALDSLINAARINNSSSGLREGALMAQNYTPDVITDDVPLVCTIQVQAEKLFAGGKITDMRFRAPTPSEIKVQGFLSICYGAKGLTYYTINTQSPQSSDLEQKLATYGLFDETGNTYNDNGGNLTGLHQNPANPQKPNKRFYAVKELNSSIDKFGSELLQLTWRNGYNIHTNAGYPSYISSVSSYTTDGSQDSNPTSTYVELGTFKKTTQMNNDNLEYFFVVNRRTLSTESRKITVTFNKSSSYTTWQVTEVGANNTWILNKTGNFQTTYQPGEGKLFKFEPLF